MVLAKNFDSTVLTKNSFYGLDEKGNFIFLGKGNNFAVMVENVIFRLWWKTQFGCLGGGGGISGFGKKKKNLRLGKNMIYGYDEEFNLMFWQKM